MLREHVATRSPRVPSQFMCPRNAMKGIQLVWVRLVTCSCIPTLLQFLFQAISPVPLPWNITEKTFEHVATATIPTLNILMNRVQFISHSLWITFSSVEHFNINACCSVFVLASFCKKHKVVIKSDAALNLSHTGHFWVPLCLCFKTSQRANHVKVSLIRIKINRTRTRCVRGEKTMGNGLFTNQIL